MKPTKYILIIAIILCSFLVSCQKTTSEVKIGAVLPMSGNAAGYGQWMQRGILLAVDDINNAKTAKEPLLKVIIEDSKSDNRAGVDAANKLINIDKVSAMVSVQTGVCKSVIPLTEKVPMIHFALALTPKLTEEGKYVFRNITSIDDIVLGLVDVCKKEKYTKVAIIHNNNPTGIWASELMTKKLTESGSQVVASETFEPTDTDFRTQLVKIKKSNPQALYISAYQQNGLIMKQAREIGLKCQFLGGDETELPELLTTAGQACEGTIYAIAAFNPENATGPTQAFVAKFTSKFNEKPEIFGASAYDAIQIIRSVLIKFPGDVGKQKEQILSLKEYPGVSGQTTFLPNGDVSKPVLIKRITNKEYVLY